MDKVEFGLIGGGLMGKEFASAVGRWHHLSAKISRPTIVAVCDTDPQVLAWYREHCPSVRLFTSDYQELLDYSPVKAVYCPVPHYLHEKIYQATIEKGKHLLGEKPFGIDLEVNRKILQTLQKNPQVFARCSSEIPYFPGAQKWLELFEEKDPGKIIEVEAGFLHSSDLDFNKPINWKRQNRTHGVYGCMGDLGMHILHIPLRLGWKPKTVYANLSNLAPQRKNSQGEWVECDTWDNANLYCQVQQKDQKFPLILKTWRMAPGETNTWYLKMLATKRSIYYSTKDTKKIYWMDLDAGKQRWQCEDLGYDSLFPAITGKIFEFGFADSILQMWAAFMDEMTNGKGSYLSCVTPEETQQAHSIFTSALKSNTLNQNLEIEYETFGN